MKNCIKKRTVYGLIACLIVFSLSSCNEKITVGEIDQTSYVNSTKSFVRLNNEKGVRRDFKIDLGTTETVSTKLHTVITNVAASDVKSIVEVDLTLVEAYNKDHFTTYNAFPTELVSFDIAEAVVKAGDLKSNEITMTLTSATTLEKVTYVLPIAIKSSTPAEVEISSEADIIYYLISFVGDIPSAAKPSGIISICYIEANDNNPLNVGSYTLENSGKPFFDIAMIFAANINYNAETGRPYIYLNANVGHILTNRDKYIKPLQNKGIKVSLTLLPNHAGIGLLNMPDDAIQDFAMQCKAIVDAYNLDGVDFDEEWADYSSHPEMPTTNSTSYGKLLKEVRRIMPNKLVTVYAMDPKGLNNPVDGVDVGDIIDYAYQPYYGQTNTTTSQFSGLRKEQWGPTATAFDNEGRGSVPPLINVKNFVTQIVTGGFGVNLTYNLTNLNRANGSNNFTDYITEMSSVLYNENTVLTGEIYSKDW